MLGSTNSFEQSSTSPFGQKPAFVGFGSTPSQTNPFEIATQPSQPAFGSSISGSSIPFSASSQPAFGSTGALPFSATSTPAFSVPTSTPAFSVPTSTPAFVPTYIPDYIGGTKSAFSVLNTPFAFSKAEFRRGKRSENPAFGSASVTPFGDFSSPAFYFDSTPQPFGSSSLFGSKISAFRDPFGFQTPTSAFENFDHLIGNISRDSYPVCRDGKANISIIRDRTEENGHKYETYESCVAIAGANYCVIAKDNTRDHAKISQLTEKCVMASCGSIRNVQHLLAGSLIYEDQHKEPMSCPAMAVLLSHLKKFYLCYGIIVLGGLDNEGKGCIFIGDSCTDDSGRINRPPIIEYKSSAKDDLTPLSETEAVNQAKTFFASETLTGDKLEIVVLNASGLRREYMDLRKD